MPYSHRPLFPLLILHCESKVQHRLVQRVLAGDRHRAVQRIFAVIDIHFIIFITIHVITVSILIVEINL